MAVPTYNLEWEQGNDLPVNLVYKEGAPGAEAPVDLSTDYSVRMDIRKETLTGAHVYTFNSDDITETPSVDEVGAADNEAVLGADGTINIKVPRSLTLPGGPINTAVESGTSVFVYDVFLRNTVTDTQRKILSGNITVNRSATLWA